MSSVGDVVLTPPLVRENFLRAAEFRSPMWIPSRVSFAGATWYKYREKLEQLILRHRRLFPFFRKGSVKFDALGVRRQGNIFVDEWGCVWKFPHDGLQGIVVKHPLEDWRALDNLRVPDPDEGLPREGDSMLDWEEVKETVRRARKEGSLVVVGMPHGFFFQRLYYLRGFNNLMLDFVRGDSRLDRLIDLLTEYNLELVKRIIRLGVDVVSFGDDLGTQNRMPISPTLFRRYIYPAYRKIFGYVRAHGVHVYLHSDGHVMEVVDMLIESGVTILNIQDVVNGIENIARACKGRVCIDLDIDRQHLLPRGTPAEIERHIVEAIHKLGSRRGGLMLTAGVYPDVPLRNIEALCLALERHMEDHLFLP